MDRMNENAIAVETTDQDDFVASEIGGPKDDFNALDRKEGTSVRRCNLMREGYHAGYNSAADDYLNGKVNLEYFEMLRTERDVTDFYAIGFELGYFRKLAEIAVL